MKQQKRSSNIFVYLIGLALIALIIFSVSAGQSTVDLRTTGNSTIQILPKNTVFPVTEIPDFNTTITKEMIIVMKGQKRYLPL